MRILKPYLVLCCMKLFSMKLNRMPRKSGSSPTTTVGTVYEEYYLNSTRNWQKEKGRLGYRFKGKERTVKY